MQIEYVTYDCFQLTPQPLPPQPKVNSEDPQLADLCFHQFVPPTSSFSFWNSKRKKTKNIYFHNLHQHDPTLFLAW